MNSFDSLQSAFMKDPEHDVTEEKGNTGRYLAQDGDHWSIRSKENIYRRSCGITKDTKGKISSSA